MGLNEIKKTNYTEMRLALLRIMEKYNDENGELHEDINKVIGMVEEEEKNTEKIKDSLNKILGKL